MRRPSFSTSSNVPGGGSSSDRRYHPIDRHAYTLRATTAFLRTAEVAANHMVKSDRLALYSEGVTLWSEGA